MAPAIAASCRGSGQTEFRSGFVHGSDGLRFHAHAMQCRLEQGGSLALTAAGEIDVPADLSAQVRPLLMADPDETEDRIADALHESGEAATECAGITAAGPGALGDRHAVPADGLDECSVSGVEDIGEFGERFHGFATVESASSFFVLRLRDCLHGAVLLWWWGGSMVGWFSSVSALSWLPHMFILC